MDPVIKFERKKDYLPFKIHILYLHNIFFIYSFGHPAKLTEENNRRLPDVLSPISEKVKFKPTILIPSKILG